MQSLKDVADAMLKVLVDERRECNWDHATFAKSPYVYMSRQGVLTLKEIVGSLNDLAAHYAKVDEGYTKEMQLHAAALQELTRVADESERLKELIESRGGIINNMAGEIRMLKSLLVRIRALFGGSVKDPKEVGVLLEEVDKVLK